MDRLSVATRTARIEWLGAAVAATSCGVGVSVLVGWAFHLPGLRQVNPNLGSMMPRSAFCLALAGAAMLLRRHAAGARWRFALGQTLAAWVAIAAGLSLVRSLAGWTPPWDQWPPIVTLGGLFPGQMPSTVRRLPDSGRGRV